MSTTLTVISSISIHLFINSLTAGMVDFSFITLSPNLSSASGVRVCLSSVVVGARGQR